ncbi:MAG TPA: histidine kinase [Sphingomonas sp.]|nr:histidine kinase [Sphingomonas sp.]
MDDGREARTSEPGRRAVAIALAWFWGVFVLLNTARALALGFPHPGGALLRRIFVGLVGAGLAWGMYKLIAAFRASSPRTQLTVAGLASVPAGLLFATTNFLVFDVLAPLPGETCAQGRACTLGDAAVAITQTLINWSFVFAAWGLLYIAMAWAAETQAAERRASTYREAARLAEIRALRYQVNPHFLFNVLNSLGALVRRRDSVEAEGLIEEIGRFFRHSLSVDPVADTTLGDEIDMQLRYLSIERRRFPDRLMVDIDIAPALRSAPVPALILQPLVENVIKHGVGRTTAMVHAAIRADLPPDGALRIVVEDDAPAPDDDSSTAGLGVGLRNVAERLEARYGPTARLVAGPRDDVGYRAELIIPFIRR